MNEKKYLIDDNPASARDIINKAKEVDPEYGAEGFCTTSGAAQVLEEHGYSVSENPNY
jgi:hypothetical protein